MITASPGMTMRVFGAALAGRMTGRLPGLVTRPPVTWPCPVTTPVFRLKEHDDETAAARSEPRAGSTTDRAGIRDDALTAPAESVMIPVCRSPALSALGMITGEPPEYVAWPIICALKCPTALSA